MDDKQQQQQQQTSFLDTLPEEIRNEPCLKTVPDVATLAKNYVHAQRLVGVDKIPRPNAKWTDKEWAEYYAAGGRPDAADKYSVPKLELEDGIKIEDAALERVRKQCFDMGLNQRQFEATLKAYTDELNNDVRTFKSRQKAATEKALADLRAKFGDQTDGKLQLAQAALAKYGDEGLKQRVVASGLGNDITFIEMLAAVGELMIEDKIPSPGGKPALAPVDVARRQIQDLKMDQAFTKVLLDQQAPGHKEAVQRWEELHRVAFPNPK